MTNIKQFYGLNGEIYCDLNYVCHKSAKGYFCLTIFWHITWQFKNLDAYVYMEYCRYFRNTLGACSGTKYQIVICIMSDCAA